MVRRQAKYHQIFCRQGIVRYFAGEAFTIIGEREEGRMADALAHGGDEGRDKLR